MVKNIKEQQEGIFFVELKEPPEVKRNVLEALKDILGLMQQFEKFKQIRHEKLVKIQRLRSLVRDTNKMFGTLKAKLPQTNFKTPSSTPVKKQSKKIASKKEKAAPKEVTPKKHKTELDKLESELNAIEEKLKEFA